MAFSRETIDFLFENKLQDSRDWYYDHQADYRKWVLEPMAEFVTALTPTMLGMDPELICVPKVGKSISRIWRDTRFSHDKSLFRDVVWCVFLRDKKLYQGLPAFFFELSPAGFDTGCGWYATDPKVMAVIRQLILQENAQFQEAFAALADQSYFALEGDKYVRSKYASQPDALRDWLDRKSLSAIHYDTDFDLLFSDELAGEVGQKLQQLAPVYRFFMTCQHLAKQADGTC